MNDGGASPGRRPAAPADMRWLFFSPSGRVSRQPFILGWLFVTAVNGFVLARLIAQPEEGAGVAFWGLLALLSALVNIACCIMLSVKRLHDMGVTGLVAGLLLVPALSVIVLLVLSIRPGESGPNAYGERTNAPMR